MGMTEFLLVVAVGGGIVAVLFATFRGAARDAETEERRSESSEPIEVAPELAELEERRLATLRSLEEIEADLEAGNLSSADYESLRQRYQKEAELLAHSLRSLASASAKAGAPRPQAAVPAASSRIPTAIGWVAGSAAFVALAWLVMSSALRPRSDNDTITGSLPGQEMGAAASAPIAEVDEQRLSELEKQVAADSSNVQALDELGHLYLTLQRYGEVARVTMKALELDPDDPEALTHMGMLLVSVEHMDEGLAAFDRALEADPNFAEALLFKGMMAFRNQDFTAATEAWERYLNVAPADADVARIQAMLEMARQSARQQDSS